MVGRLDRWPTLRSYTGVATRCVALPLGGIGTGTVSLGGRGQLCDWEIGNRPAKGFTPQSSFFAIHARAEGRDPVTRVLEGQLLPPFDGALGVPIPGAGLPRLRSASFHTAYPLAEVRLSDSGLPVRVRLRAFNPLVPGDCDASGLPVAVLRFAVRNVARTRAEVSICGNLHNFIGFDGNRGESRGNVNTVVESGRLHGISMSSNGVPRDSEQWGTIALSTTSRVSTLRSAWLDTPRHGDALLDFWDDFSDDGQVDPRDHGGADAPMASLVTSMRLDPGAQEEVTFLLTWHFPNRLTWTPADGIRVGNHYTTRFADAWDVAEQVAAGLPELERRTVAFVTSFVAAGIPDAFKEAALFTLPALRSKTSFRTEDGRFFGWEGCADAEGCCAGTCTHVWNYEHATAFLFGSLARSMRDTEFGHATGDDGRMSFRVLLPLAQASTWPLAAADGQMGCVMKLYRDWQLSGDESMLRRLWPAVRRALEFCWMPGGWDADRDGVMEGCQHNTMDVEYFGPNPEVGFWYLGALRAAGRMAEHLGDTEFASTCGRLLRSGSERLDAELFNGAYYEQRVVPVEDVDAIAPGLRGAVLEEANRPEAPHSQIGAGCMTDQMVGQLMAHISGLEHLTSAANQRTTLRTIMRHNFRRHLHGDVNHMRAYALGDEAGMVLASYPRGQRPQRPFPYFSEVWTGVEYTAAAHMVYEGMVEEAVRCVAAVRARHDGERRNPFDDAECGHHYARAMSAWALVVAATGFRWSALDGSFEVGATTNDSTFFWSNGDSWGTVRQRRVDGQRRRVTLSVREGRLDVNSVRLRGFGVATLPRRRTVEAGGRLNVTVSRDH